jgi:uncharacterized repeat protein (TIGR04042 family)
MPETRFQIEWPDGSQETCYSPSSVVKKYFSVNESYDLEDFLSRVSEALNLASDRVQAKYGRPCGLALGQLQEIEMNARKYRGLYHPKVKIKGWL